MLVKFGVVRSLPVSTSEARIFVTGEALELGAWIDAVQLTVSQHCAADAPSFWSGSVEVDWTAPFVTEYKFITKYKRRSTTSANANSKKREIEWEGAGTQHNRKLEISKETVRECLLDHVFYVPVCHWLPASGDCSERMITRFYTDLIRGRKGPTISYNAVADGIFLGSCPREPDHIQVLKSLGVTAVMNFQTESDVEKNSLFVLRYQYSKSAAASLQTLYDHHGIGYIWMPAADVSTEGRMAVLAHGAYLLWTLVKNGHKVYVHCNAGVGRSANVVAAYLNYVENMPLPQLDYILHAKRPVVYFDRKALILAKRNFQLLFALNKHQPPA